MSVYTMLSCVQCGKLYEFNSTPSLSPSLSPCNGNGCTGGRVRRWSLSLHDLGTRRLKTTYIGKTIFYSRMTDDITPELTYTFRDLLDTNYIHVDDKRPVPQIVAPSIYDILKNKEKEFSDHVNFYKAPLAIFDRQRMETAEKCIKETRELFESFRDDCLEKKFITDNSDNLSFTLHKMHLLSLINDNVKDDDSLKTFSDFQQNFIGDKVAEVSTSEDGFEQIENQ